LGAFLPFLIRLYITLRGKRPPRAAMENPIRHRYVVAVVCKPATAFRHDAAITDFQLHCIAVIQFGSLAASS